MKNFFKKIKFNREEGFTIIETLVAITILMIAIAGPMTIAQKGLNASKYARDQTTATYLAQDAIEFVKNRLDGSVFSTYIYGLGSARGMASQCPSEAQACIIESTGTGFIVRPTDQSYYDIYVPDVGYYKPNPESSVLASVQASASVPTTKTAFTRKFYIDTFTSVNGQNEATLVVVVEWYSGEVKNEVRLVEQVYAVQL